MPSKIHKRGKTRIRATVTVKGVKKEKLFPDATKKSYREAMLWEEETRKMIENRLSQTNLEYLPIGEWANEYLEDAFDRFVPKTFHEKKTSFARFFRHTKLERDFPIDQLTVSISRKFLAKQAKDRSGYAANKDRKNLGAAWGWGLDNMEGWPKGQNPFLSVKKFPEIRKPRYVPPEEDFWKVFDLTEDQDQVMLLTFLHLAARRGEIFNLTWSDVDFSNKRICLWTRKREAGHKEVDRLPMTNELRDVLLNWWETRLSQSTIDKEHVFVCLDKYSFCDRHYGKPFKHRQHFMRRLCEKAGVKRFGFHAIRHLSASILYKKGYSQSVIQAVLRHKNPNTTSRYLRSLGLEETREALEESFARPAKVLPFKEKMKNG